MLEYLNYAALLCMADLSFPSFPHTFLIRFYISEF